MVFTSGPRPIGQELGSRDRIGRAVKLIVNILTIFIGSIYDLLTPQWYHLPRPRKERCEYAVDG